MSALVIALITFVCAFGGALIGMRVHTRIVGRHLDQESTDVVKLVLGLIATMTALVLGLLTASAQSTFSGQSQGLQTFGASVIMLDRSLELYGPETKNERLALRHMVTMVHDRTWPSEGVEQLAPDPLALHQAGNMFLREIGDLTPKTDVQRFAQSQALQITSQALQTRLLMLERGQTDIPWPVLVIVIAWISALFLGFGLFTHLRATVCTAMFVGAVSVSAALFLILELAAPYGGLIHISDQPLRETLAVLAQFAPK